jgi:hypothetical protein
VAAVEEIQIVREAARRIGAEILEMGIGPDGRARGRVRCRDGWHAAKFLVALGDADRRRGWSRDMARRLRAMTSAAGRTNDWAFVAYAHASVQNRVRFRRETGEIFAGPAFTWNCAVGDCDDHARLLYALLAAGGVPVRLAFLYREWSEGPAHVCVQAFYDGAWHWCETTIAAELGEEPYAAAARLGVLNARSDIAKQVMTMSESDLPPVPAGFDARTTPAQLARDARALQELGYLCDASGITVPDDPRFRVAVQAFQRARSLKPDGLIGPKTRGDIGALVPWYAQTIGDVTGLTSYLSDQFFADVAAMARDFQAEGATATAEDFLAVWLSESGCDPRMPGHSPFDQPSHGAFGGLNQMDATARKNVGFTGTLQDWLSLPDVEQLAFVRKFYEVDVRAFCGGRFACLTDLGALYLMNFLPAFMPHAGDPSFVLVRADNDPHGFYRDNAGLDVGHKGWIEVGDMAKVANGAKARNPKKWAELQERLSSAGGAGGGSGGDAAGVSVGGIVFLGLAAAGLVYALTRA